MLPVSWPGGAETYHAARAAPFAAGTGVATTPSEVAEPLSTAAGRAPALFLAQKAIMQIQVNTGSQTEGSEELTRRVEAVVENSLGRFGDQITRVEVHLNDANGSQKHGDHDKRCVMEARLAGLLPISVTADGSTLEQALGGAADKLEKTLKRTLGRLDDSKRRTSYGGDPSRQS